MLIVLFLLMLFLSWLCCFSIDVLVPSCAISVVIGPISGPSSLNSLPTASDIVWVPSLNLQATHFNSGLNKFFDTVLYCVSRLFGKTVNYPHEPSDLLNFSISCEPWLITI
eukprot:GHVS01082109.1.p1 GENE.GHVS01082109.1~~GHVS01082109.1.p1  ORF type:complete len:111 (-),score=0.77 GHVS01082109.1:155-487(-)